jgi:hypothetical protein
LFSKLRNIHPVIVNYVFNELLFSFIFPEKRRVSPLVLSAVFGDFVTDLIKIVDDLRGILLNVKIITNFVIKDSILKLYFFLFNILSVRILFLLHSRK